ncbi:hypothetical protein [Endozoicomonas ascidiicola]|uniref:hypothetical protein n=1 Tax=Endozoicomonas ascidiicola TaxID=1698521 RepID=UPI0008367D0F|nr:hypothetical protein [Endozoicomonas ascidiicola]
MADYSQQQSENILRWLKGDRQAYELAFLIFDISQVWDDLIDGDKEVSTAERERLFRLCMVDLPKNPFYQQNFHSLFPIIEEKIYTWLDCNNIERAGSEAQLKAAYILRSVTTDIVIHMAYLIGGFDWRRVVAYEMRDFIYSDNELFVEYRKEHRGF